MRNVGARDAGVRLAMTPLPPSTPPGELLAIVATRGWAVVDADGLRAITAGGVVEGGAFSTLLPSWSDLPVDTWLKDGGSYRKRRHACFVVDVASNDAAGADVVVTAVPHRPHWQPIAYNALHGGIERWFQPIEGVVVDAAPWTRLLAGLARVCATLQPAARGSTARWFVEAHQFRIDTAGGIGRPTPEGAHRDGVDFVAIVFVGRHGIKGGETRVFDADGPNGVRFTLSEPWSALLLDDERVIHETTPIQPIDAAVEGHRDTLVLTYRRGGFQGPGRGDG